MFAIKDEFEEYFSIAKSYYKNYYVAIKEELTGYKLIEAKNFSKKKYLKCHFNMHILLIKKKNILGP